MSSKSNPNCPVTVFSPPPGGEVVHPMVALPSTETQPFTLLKNAQGQYELTYTDNVPANSNPNGTSNVRVYLAAFITAVSSPTWTFSFPLRTQGDLITFFPVSLGGAGNLWTGAWWDDGTFPDTPQGIAAYFGAHPAGGNHHTVTIIPG